MSSAAFPEYSLSTELQNMQEPFKSFFLGQSLRAPAVLPEVLNVSDPRSSVFQHVSSSNKYYTIPGTTKWSRHDFYARFIVQYIARFELSTEEPLPSIKRLQFLPPTSRQVRCTNETCTANAMVTEVLNDVTNINSVLYKHQSPEDDAVMDFQATVADGGRKQGGGQVDILFGRYESDTSTILSSFLEAKSPSVALQRCFEEYLLVKNPNLLEDIKETFAGKPISKSHALFNVPAEKASLVVSWLNSLRQVMKYAVNHKVSRFIIADYITFCFLELRQDHLGNLYLQRLWMRHDDPFLKIALAGFTFCYPDDKTERVEGGWMHKLFSDIERDAKAKGDEGKGKVGDSGNAETEGQSSTLGESSQKRKRETEDTSRPLIRSPRSPCAMSAEIEVIDTIDSDKQQHTPPSFDSSSLSPPELGSDSSGTLSSGLLPSKSDEMSSASDVTAFLKVAALGNSILDYDKFLDSGGEINTIADINVGVGHWSQVTTTKFEGLDKQFVEKLYDHDLFSSEQIDSMYELGEEPHAKAEAFAQAEVDAYRALEELWGHYIPRLWYPIRYRGKPGLLVEEIPNACSVFELFGYDIEDDKCVIKGADFDPSAVFSQAEEALAAVHAHGFLHGDVDTRNIVVSRDDMHVFFVDFQWAREASQNERDKEMEKMKSLSAQVQRLYEAAMKGTFPNVFDFLQ